MARLQTHFSMLIVFGLGYLSCFIYLNSTSDEDPITQAVEVEGRSLTEPAHCQPSSTAAPPPNISAQCSCSDGEDLMAEYTKQLEQQATECVDDIVKQRMGLPMICPVLARCAMKWVVDHVEDLKPKQPQSLMDYGYDAMDYPIASAVSRDWLFLAAFLPQDTIALPTKRGMPPNLVFLSPPILHRLKAFFQTPTLLDYQFALRIDELLTYATPIGIYDLVGRILVMAKTTFLVMPCTGISDMTDTMVVNKAVEHVLAVGQERQFGVKELEVEVRTMAVFRFRTCTKELLRVTIKSLRKQVRKKWCFYPDEGLTYTVQYQQGTPTKLLITHAKGSPVEVPYISPSVGVAEIVGWGMLRDQREVMTWDMLRQPNRGSPAIHNWVVTSGGRITRRELIGPDGSGAPTGIQYVDFLRLEMCTFGPIEQGIKFRQMVADGPHGRQLVYLSRTRNFQFANGTMYGASGSSWKPREQSTPDIGECKSCTTCLAYPFPIVTATNAMVPEACEQCYTCQYARFLGRGMPLSRIFVGCTDVEGVMENSAKPPELCDDTQKGPILRPSETGT